MDPIAEKFAHVSVYNYAENSPISNIDLWGLQAMPILPGFGINVKKEDVAKQLKAQEVEGGVVAGAASLFVPGPEDGLLIVAGATKVGGAVIKAAGKAVDNIIDGVKGFFKSDTDDIAGKLQNAANEAAEIVGEGKGASHGTKVHSEFAKKVDEIDGVTPEVSYKDGKIVPYGTKGSVRPDAVEGDLWHPTNLFDLKTGSAKVGPKDIEKFKQHVPGSPTVKEIKPN